jgi:hypothetical protein
MAHKEPAMLRNLVLSLSLLCLLAICAMTINCGSSSSSNSGGVQNCSGGPFNVVGDWNITLSGGGGSVSGPGVINTAGLAVFFQTTNTVPAPGDTAVFPAITGASCFSGTATAYGTPLSGGGSMTDTVTGNVNSATSITGTLSNGSSFIMASGSPLTGSVLPLSGSYLGEIEGALTPAIWQLTFTPTGAGSSMSFSGSDGASCDVSGTFGQEGGNVSNINVFDSSMTFSGTCPDTGTGTVTGLGSESGTDYFLINGGMAETYLYSASSTSALVFEIFPSLIVVAPSPHVVSPGRRGSQWAGKF